MATGVEAVPYKNLAAMRESQLGMTWRYFRKRRRGMAALVIFLLLVLGVVFVPVLSPFRYDQLSGVPYAPFNTVDPQWGHVHWLGTDSFGRDLLTRLFYAGRSSLLVALVSMVVCVLVGTVLGAVAGLYGGWVDGALMRVADFLLALPLLPMYLLGLRLIRSVLGSAAAEIRDSFFGIAVMVLIFVFFGWMGISRLVRGSILSLRTQPFVEASFALGASNRRVIFGHLLPNCLSPVLVASTFAVGDFIVLEALLAYFGHGLLDPPTPSWGNIIANYQQFTWQLTQLNPFQDVRVYYVILPSLLILVTVLSLNYIGDALRDALNPHHMA